MAIPPRPRKPRLKADRRAHQKAETKRRLIEAAERQFTLHGYENVSLADIAAAAGVVPSLINTYFLGKAGLLYAVVTRHNEPQLAALQAAAAGPGTPPERLDRVIAIMAEMDLRHPRLIAGLQGLSWTWPPETEAQNREDLAPFFELVGGLLREGLAQGSFRPVPEALAVEAIWDIYTMGLRPAVFGQMTPGECAVRIQAIVAGLLRPLPGERAPG